jgi:hypothetical protein
LLEPKGSKNQFSKAIYSMLDCGIRWFLCQSLQTIYLKAPFFEG